ncbi:C40 family peptidase [Flavobacterium sp. J27]|uniref:C40 family peptidase n=1 Tax=Flavobacterium sp. J27 TaxID=2060419 RepID=UPI0013EE810D|nr:C40 family peptidase [Flavobacterium sp. J27]
MKKITYFILLAITIVSCKTQSNIVTSKDEAISKGMYSYSKEKGSNTNLGKEAFNKEEENEFDRNAYVRVSKSDNATANKIVDVALENLGVKYKIGGTTKTGMDCSGLVFSSFGSYDVVLPRTSIDMSKHGEMISTREAQPGDLIFFKTNGKSVINHVGIIVEVLPSEIKFIHSSTQKGVIVSSTSDAYYGKTFAQINRVLNY